MTRLLLIGFLLTIFGLSGYSQTNIQIEIENSEIDTVILGYYYADKILVTDTLFSQDNRSYSYSQDSLLPPGMYLIVTKPAGDFYQVLIDDKDQEFTVNIDKNREVKIQFDGSEENSIFYDYMSFLNRSRTDIAKIDNALATTDSVMISIIDQLKKDKEMINRVVQETQNKIIKDYPNSLTTLLLKSNLPFVFPEFTGTSEEIDEQKYLYYKKYYFDNVNLVHPAIFRTPVLQQRINYYMTNLTPHVADSITTSLDHIFSMLEPNNEAFQYYLSYYLNSYGNSKFIGMDAVYVHLALNYYGKGKTPWVSEENLNEIVNNAKKIEPTLIGKAAPDFTLKRQDGTSVSLSDFNKDFTIMLFWKPDCGHCSKAMPHIVDFVEKYKDESVDLLTICTKTGEKYSECWEGVKEKKMETLLNVGDEYHKSRIFSKYFVNTTPAIFILDKEKNIKLKKVPAENLDAVMVQLMKERDGEEGNMN